MKKTPIIGILISIFFIILAFWNFNLDEFIEAFSSVNISYIFLAVCVFLFSYVLRAIRWQIILRSIKEISFSTSFCVLFIGYMANAILPFRMGEIVRAYILGVKENISKLAALSSIILERMIDGITLVFFFGILLIIYPFPEWVKGMGILIALLFIGGLTFLFVVTYFKAKTMKFFDSVFRLFSEKLSDKVLPYFEKFVLGTGMLKNKSQSLSVIIISIIIWLNEALFYYILLIAFNISSYLLFIIAIFTMVVINFGIMIPSAPGNIGTYHYSCILALTLFGINYNMALAYAIVANAMLIICTVIAGVFCMWYMGFSISNIKEKVRKY